LKFKNIGILITDHNVNETLSICDRAYLLIDGKIFQHGTAEELSENEQVRRLYLGRNFELKRKDWLLEQGRTDVSVASQRLAGYVQWMLDNIDSIIADDSNSDKWTCDKLRDQAQMQEFQNSYEKVIQSIESFGVEKKIDKLHEYATELRKLEIDKISLTGPLGEMGSAVTKTFGALPIAVDSIATHQKDENFKNLLREARSYLENSRLIIDNPEFANVLS
jgi:ABC-type multidrug transport system ATPase subunit